MSNDRKHEAFNKLYRTRNDMYLMYLNSISTKDLETYLNKLSAFVHEIVGVEYDFNKIEDINSAISKLSKFRNVQVFNQRRFRFENSDYSREHNSLIVAIEGLSAALFYKAINVTGDENLAIKKMRDDISSNASGVMKFMKSYQIGELELTQTMYKLYNARVNSETLCKIIKHMIKRLHKRRCQLESATM